MTDLPTPRTMLPQSGWLCLLVWCKACGHQDFADLKAIMDYSGRGDVPLIKLRFRCTACGSQLTDSVVTGKRGRSSAGRAKPPAGR